MKSAGLCWYGWGLAFLPFLALGGWTTELGVGEHPSAAVARVRAARQSGALKPGEEAEVVFAPGIHRLSGVTKMEKGDGPLVFRARQAGSVRLTGGIEIEPSRWSPVTDAAMRERFQPEVRDRIRVADLSAEFPNGLPPMEDRLQMLPAPWLYRPDGTPAPIARWPNDGQFTYFDKTVNSGLSDDPAHPGQKMTVPGGAFVFREDRIRRWKLEDGVWLFGYFIYGWSSDTVRIASYSPSDRVVTLAGRTSYGIGSVPSVKYRYCALNLPEEIDRPDEWWFDRKRARLYALLSDEKKAYTLATDVGDAFYGKDIGRIRFENLEFDSCHGAGRGALLALIGNGCRVTSCRFSGLAQPAVETVGTDNVISNCVIEHMGGTCVKISGGDVLTLSNGRSALVDTRISDIGTFKKTFVQAVDLRGCGNAVRRCLIEKSPYIAIWYGGNEHLIESNEFRDLSLETNDSGAVYEGGDPTSLGTILFGNYVHDLGDRAHWGARNGFYFDDLDWGAWVIGNTFERMGYATEIGGGNLHVFRNNVIRDCLRGFRMDCRGVTWQKRGAFIPEKDGCSYIEKKARQKNFRNPPWCVAYPDYVQALDECPELPWRNEISGNVVAGCQGFTTAPEIAGLVEPGLWRDNVVVTNLETAPVRAKLPVSFADAQEMRLVRACSNGVVEAAFALDIAGRLSWRVAASGRSVLNLSPLGLTVAGRDYGKLVVPRTVRPLEDGGAALPLCDLTTGREIAVLEGRITPTGAAEFRWRIPAQGDEGRTVAGELSAFCLGVNGEMTVCSDEPADWPKSEYVTHAGRVTVVYPNFRTGFRMTGEIISPWRGVRGK